MTVGVPPVFATPAFAVNKIEPSLRIWTSVALEAISPSTYSLVVKCGSNVGVAPEITPVNPTPTLSPVVRIYCVWSSKSKALKLAWSIKLPSSRTLFKYLTVTKSASTDGRMASASVTCGISEYLFVLSSNRLILEISSPPCNSTFRSSTCV